MNENLEQLGWQNHFEQQVSLDEKQQYLLARVSAHYGSQIHLFTAPDEEITAPTSILEPTDRNTRSSSIAVGDWLLLETNDYRSVRLLERKTLIARKAAGETVKPQLIAANVDSVFIVSSCNLDFNLSRLERYLALALESDAEPIVVLTKSDQCENPSALRRTVESMQRGLVVETMDARDEEQAAVLTPWCGLGKTIVLLGSSGVGKSTLANALGGFQIRTQGIREDDDKGRHTTTARSMHRLKTGGWLIDTPGMRELQLADCAQGVAEVFDDIVELTSACKFRNCAHRGDDGCALEDAVERGELDARRLNNYLKLLREQARNSRTLAEQRERDRKTGKFYKRVIKGKKQRRGN